MFMESTLSLGLPLMPVEALTMGFVLPEALPSAPEAALAEAPLAVDRATGAVALSGAQVRQGFRIGELGLMIRYEDGSELTELQATYRLPNSPAWLHGMTNLHGVVVPVIDLAEFWGLPAQHQARRMLLVLSRGADATGVLIDGLPQRLRWGDEERIDMATAAPALQPVLRDACLIDGNVWFDLECDKLLDELENALQGG